MLSRLNIYSTFKKHKRPPLNFLWQLTCQPRLVLLFAGPLASLYSSPTDLMIYDSDSGCPVEKAWRGVAIPPEETQMGARVEHLMVDKPGMVSQLVAEALELPVVSQPVRCAELIRDTYVGHRFLILAAWIRPRAGHSAELASSNLHPIYILLAEDFGLLSVVQALRSFDEMHISSNYRVMMFSTPVPAHAALLAGQHSNQQMTP